MLNIVRTVNYVKKYVMHVMYCQVSQSIMISVLFERTGSSDVGCRETKELCLHHSVTHRRGGSLQIKGDVSKHIRLVKVKMQMNSMKNANKEK